MNVKACSGALPGRACAAASVESSAMRSARTYSTLTACNVSAPVGWGWGEQEQQWARIAEPSFLISESFSFSEMVEF